MKTELKRKYNSKLFLCSRQPNEQARVVAPVLTGAKLKLMAQSGNATNMIIVRHPFDRWIELSTKQLHNRTFSPRIVSAFRDKLEKCLNQSCNLKTHWYGQLKITTHYN